MKRIISLFILICLTFTLTGCIGDKEEYELYFASKEGTGFKTEEIKLDKTISTEAKAKKMVEALLKGPKKADCLRVIPEDTALISLRAEGNMITVNLSQNFEKTKDDTVRLLSIYSLINTLCALDGVKRVQILVNGRNMKYSASEEEIGPLSTGNLIMADEIGKNQSIVVELYFANKEKNALVSERRLVDIKDNETVEKTAVDELFEGPDDKGKKILPSELKLLSVETKDKLCYVNFSKEFISLTENNAKLCIYSVVNTLTSLPNISAVQFFVDGEKADEVGGISLAEPFTFNQELVK